MPRPFPDGFRWGTATAAHQVEGGNWANDWWAWEHRPGTVCAEPSGDACDHYHRYESDIALLAGLGFDSFRFSVEWSRIEPEEGWFSTAALDHYGDHRYESDIALLAGLGFDSFRFSVEWSRIEPEEGWFSTAALDHYRRVCAACLAHGVEPVVTFHHFTTPRWAAADGGWHDPRIVDRFGRFCQRAVAHLGDLVGRACTINEPNVVSYLAYGMGLFPPGTVDEGRYVAARDHFIAAHRRATEVLKAGRGDFPVGLTLSMTDYHAVPAGDPAAVATRDAARALVEDPYLEACRGDDFLGVQPYSRSRWGPDGELGPEDGVPVLVMGYEYWPDALAATLRRAWEVTGGVPLLVTENGIGTDDDAQRLAYVRTALGGVLDCLDEGIDVRGYTYWSLLDNFEWFLGYGPRFGIVAVDRATQRRRVQPSGEWLGRVARENTLPDG